jgi:hypothetical protein
MVVWRHDHAMIGFIYDSEHALSPGELAGRTPELVRAIRALHEE